MKNLWLMIKALFSSPTEQLAPEWVSQGFQQPSNGMSAEAYEKALVELEDAGLIQRVNGEVFVHAEVLDIPLDDPCWEKTKDSENNPL